jgi:ABC-2 type transport system ATP-binding protein
MTDAMLSLRGLTKRYGTRVALDALDLTLRRGEFTALLGPNGAGKSTLFQVLTGLFAADEGEVEVAGHSLRHDAPAALRHIGVVFQQIALDLDLSVERNLRFQADLHGLPRATARARIAELSAALGITGDLVELVRALLHAPQVLLMDEASVGLDPQSRRDLTAAIRADMSARSTCVLWATHLVEEAEAADRVLVLHRGRLLADGTPDAVRRQLGGDSLEEAFITATKTVAAAAA